MKIRALDEIGVIKQGDVLEAIVSSDKNAAFAFEPKNSTGWFFYKENMPRFEIIEEEQETPSRIMYGDKTYSLEELKALKEFFG